MRKSHDLVPVFRILASLCGNSRLSTDLLVPSPHPGVADPRPFSLI